MKIIFTVHGNPVAKGRARAFLRGGHVRHYTPEKTLLYERRVRETAHAAMIVAGHKKTSRPVMVTVSAKMPVPASWSKSKKADAIAGKFLPATKPDLDNLLKSVLDGMNDVIFVDDSQIVTITASKCYSVEPRVEITVDEVVNAD